MPSLLSFPPTGAQVVQHGLQVHEILELSIPAVRYLRAFTAACVQVPSETGAPHASWAAAVSPLWERFTHEDNGM
jgi:hypothetical protein